MYFFILTLSFEIITVAQKHPLFLHPGPDLDLPECLPVAQVSKYYRDNSMFYVHRARAGQYSNWGEAPKFLLVLEI